MRVPACLRWRRTRLVLLVVPISLSAQTRTITGTVSRSTGGPLAGATVQLVNDRAVATTSEAGRYSLVVPDSTVRISYRAIGFRAQTAVVPRSVSTLDVTLVQDVFSLEQLVVTGQQTGVERRNATTSTSVVTTEDLARVPAPTVDKALQGKVAGAVISQNSGAPGGGVQIQIRGNNTIIGGADPLFVVDGVIYSNATIPTGLSSVTGSSANRGSGDQQDDAVNRIADLNPQDIESIEILKSAAAASIYGSKAANGVVVITTRRGRAGRPRVDLLLTGGYFDPMRGFGPRPYDTTTAFAQFGRDVVLPYVVDGKLPVYDHGAELFKRSPLSYESQLDVSGGNADTRYYLSGGWKHDGGIMLNTAATRQNVRANLDQAVRRDLQLQFSSTYTRNLTQRGFTNNDNFGASIPYTLAYIPSFIPITKRQDGTYPEPAITYKGSNPLQTADLAQNDDNAGRFTSGLTLSYQARSSAHNTLSLVGAAGVDYFSTRTSVFASPDLYFERSFANPGVSTVGNADSRFINWNVNAVDTYTPASGRFSATTSAGIQYEDQSLSRNSATATGLLPGQTGIDQGSVFGGALELRTAERTFALYAQEQFLAFSERLLLAAGMRTERSSNAGDVDKYYLYPKLSASYRFPDLLRRGNELKLRAAYGETGNRPTFGQKFTTLGVGTIAGQVGTFVGGIAGDANITPERVREIEGGVDMSFANGRATLEVTAYERKTVDMLLDVAAIPSSGFNRRFSNDASMRNRGLEIGAGWSILQAPRWSWLARSTFTAYRNKVLTLPAEIPDSGGYRPQFAGFGTAYGEFFVKRGKPVDLLIGQVVDAEGNTKTVELGRASPDFRLTLANDARFHGLSLYFLWDWQKGGLAQNQTLSLYDCNNLAPDGNTPGGQARYEACNTGDARPFVESTTFVKLREASLTLDLPSSVTRRIGGRTARVSLTGRNLILVTDYHGYDPEVSNYGQQGVTRNIDLGAYPPSRSFFLTLSLGY